jgi:hypothetical protein
MHGYLLYCLTGCCQWRNPLFLILSGQLKKRQSTLNLASDLKFKSSGQLSDPSVSVSSIHTPTDQEINIIDVNIWIKLYLRQSIKVYDLST